MLDFILYIFIYKKIKIHGVALTCKTSEPTITKRWQAMTQIKQ